MTVDSLRASLADRYTIERELGHGGMATVYLAHDLKHDREVAIKVLRPELAASLGAERFLREIRTMGNLRHPHILPLYDSGDANGFLFYVMPVIRGESLRDRIDREGALPIDDAIRFAREVAEALGHAHAAGVIHRDVKPANILLEQGHAVLADFGIARAVGQAGGARITASGMSIGTPHYMSPEQSFAEDNVDGRSDLYSLGCVLYEMLGGEPPYTGSNPQIVFAKRMSEPVPHISTIRETVPPALDATVTRLLAKAPIDRFQAAAEVVAALDGSTTPGATVVPTSAAAASTARRPRRALAIAAALTVVLLVTWQASQRRAGERVPQPSPDLLAIVPFTVQGDSALHYLGTGMVDMLSTTLDGAGTVRVAGPRVVMGFIHDERIDVAEPDAGRRVATALGASRYVTGTVVAVGNRLQFTARLHGMSASNSAGGSTSLATVTTVGSPESVFEMVDSLAIGLLQGTLTDSAGTRLQRLATVTTSKLPALKEFLEAEQLVRRGGRFREAAEAYQRAVEIDTAFALAHYRKSLAGDWVDMYDVRSSADKAMALADRLSRRDRSLMEALVLRRHGRSAEAEQRYREHLRTWPDEVEALIQLGEILFHDGPRRGRSMNEAIPVYEEAIRLEPSSVDARVHLSRLYALGGEIEKLRADVTEFERFAAAAAPDDVEASGGERLFEVQALGAHASQDSAGMAHIRHEIVGKPPFYFFYAVHSISRFARDPEAAQVILGLQAQAVPLLQVLESNLHLVRGQDDALRRFFQAIPGGRTVQWDMYEAFLNTSGAIAPDTVRMTELVRRLRDVEPATLRRTNWVEAYEDLDDDFHAFERDYQLALLLIQLGRTAEAAPLIAGLRAHPPLDHLGDLQADAVRSLEAEQRVQAGDPAGALRILRTISYEAPHAATYHQMVDGSRSRFLRAELELVHGDTATALGFYRGFDESWSPWDMFHRAIVYQRLGEIAEARKDRPQAIRYYNWLLDLWRDADPSLDARRARIVEHRDALIAATN